MKTTAVVRCRMCFLYSVRGVCVQVLIAKPLKGFGARRVVSHSRVR